MRTLLTLTLVLAFFSTGSLRAQYQAEYASPRVGQTADDLKRATERLADRMTRDVIGGPANTRAQLAEAVLAQQIDATATLLLELVRYRRPLPELQQVVAEITDLARRAPSFSTQVSYWRAAQESANSLGRQLGAAGQPPGSESRPVIGRLDWRGVVDNRVHLVIRGGSVEVNTIAGTGRPEGNARFTSPLPRAAVEVAVAKLAGRGVVRVVQQPARLNDFTAVIEILDAGGGDDEYRVEIVWR